MDSDSGAASKLRLMCSHGGQIVHRPHDKSLCYSGGETRIVAIERTAAASFSALSEHLSRSISHCRPFRLKYQLPGEGLDALISVVNDEDLLNMIDELDRLHPPARIRLFLFPVDSRAMDSKSGGSKGFGSDFGASIERAEDRRGSETNLSFRSTSSTTSMANSPPIGVAPGRVLSSASIDSDSSVGSAAIQSKAGSSQEPLIQVAQDSSENRFSGHLSNILTSKPGELVEHPSSRRPDGKPLQHEIPDFHGGLHYVPQYASGSMPISPYYPVYQMPMHQPQMLYPIYFVPMGSTQYHNVSMKYSYTDPNASSSSARPPLHPQTAIISPSVTHKEVVRAQAVTESATNSYRLNTDDDPLASPSSQDPLVVASHEPTVSSEPVTKTSDAPVRLDTDLDQDIAYNPIYKTQPSPPMLPSQY